MSKKGYISRYIQIIRKVKTDPYCTFEEIQKYVESKLEGYLLQDDSINTSLFIRTFQRDLKEIRTLFGIDIQYSRKHKGYFLQDNEFESKDFQRMMEHFDMFNSLYLSKDSSPHMQLEKRRPLGTENIHGLLHAIKNKLIIQFTYQKFWEEKSSERIAEPYVLKEFKNRWYLMAKETKDNKIKTYALDRLTQLNFTNENFENSRITEIEEIYQNCFGIITPEDGEKVKTVLLSFTPLQIKYIKTLPLHHSQEIISENDQESIVQLKLYITYDFIQELLYHGKEVKVIEPHWLRDRMKKEYQEALGQYK